MEKRIELEVRGRKPEEVHELNLDNCRSSNITGLTDVFVNLEYLSMINVGLQNLKGFPSLPKLRQLDLSDNRLTGGLESLTNAPNLTHLNLSGNKIDDMAALEPLLANLKSLDMFNCGVTSSETYREKMFEFLPQMKYLDGFDKEDNECSTEGSENGEGVEDDDSEDEEGDEEDHSDLAYSQSSNAAQDEDETEDFEPGVEADEDDDVDDDEDEEDDEYVDEEQEKSSGGNLTKLSPLPPDRISLEEVEYFPEIKTAAKQQKEEFLLIRNGILQCWDSNPVEQLTFEKCLEHLQSMGQLKMMTTPLIKRLFGFLERYGFTNFGMYKFLKVAPKKDKNVIIVGAGIAGLIAARQLETFGFEVLVLEGRNRVGGRMAIMQKPPYVADLGAMVVTDLTGNPIVTIAKQLRLNLVDINTNCHLYDFDGTPVSKQKDELIEKEFNRLLESCAFLAHNVDMDRIRPTKPFSLGEIIEIVIQYVFEAYEFTVEIREISGVHLAILEPDMDARKSDQGKQLCHYTALCNIQERLINVFHKANRRRNEIVRLYSEYDRIRDVEPPPDPEENAMHDFTVRYKKYGLEEACRSYDELLKAVEALEKKLTTQELAQPSDMYLSPKDRRVLDWHIANLEFAHAAPLDELSLKGWDQGDALEFGGAHSSVPNGYASLPVLLAQGLNIQTGSIVKEIRMSSEGSTVKYVDERTGHQKVVEAAAILCTVPLGVLKKSVDPDPLAACSAIKFEPPLPQAKIASINNLGYGNSNKVILCFDRVFWDPACHLFGYINEKSEARGEFFLFLTIYNEPSLVALISGRSALILKDLLDQVIIERCLNVLKTIFSPSQVPTPKETMVTRWGMDPFSLGAYSYVAVNASGENSG